MQTRTSRRFSARITMIAAIALSALFAGIGCGNSQVAREIRQAAAPELKAGINTILTGVVSAGFDVVNSNANDNGSATTNP
jgi:hypothetical protein